MLLLAVVTAALLGGTVGATPITTRGEAREALVVRELDGGGSWLVPRRLGKLATKPPLYHWIAAGIAARRGFSDAVVRAPSALAALVVMLVTFALGLGLGGRATGWIAAAVRASTTGFWRWGSEARVDMLLAACVTASIAGFAVWLERDSRAGRAVFWLGAALGVLAKGPIGALLPGVVAAVTLVVLRAWPRWHALVVTPSAVIASTLLVGWYALTVAAGGVEVVRTQLFVENLERLFGLGQFEARADRLTFVALRTFGSHLLPWNLALGWYAWRWWYGMAATRGEHVLHAWWMTTLVVLSLSAGQRPAYLLPLYAPIAVLAARALVVAIVPRLPTRRVRLTAACALGVAVVAVLGGTQWWRMCRVRDEPLLPFAHAVARRLPDDVELRATHVVSESDVLVLAYLTGRPIRRARPHCDTAAPWYYLGPATLADRASMRVVERLERRGREPLALLRCRRPRSAESP
jgi:4-amino-4-deoxy-L-arabinose transferase-like glycosyltransferase